MSDSGRQIGECSHEKLKAWCPECLRAENAKLQAANSRLRAAIGEYVAMRTEYLRL